MDKFVSAGTRQQWLKMGGNIASFPPDGGLLNFLEGHIEKHPEDHELVFSEAEEQGLATMAAQFFDPSDQMTTTRFLDTIIGGFPHPVRSKIRRSLVREDGPGGIFKWRIAIRCNPDDRHPENE